MKSLRTLLTLALLLGGASLLAPESKACTRVIYEGSEGLIVIGRSLDWKTPIPTNVYVYPRGVRKKGSNKKGAIEWTSKYGAVYAVGYDAGVTEGMNERGLSVNGLFCTGTVYSDSTDCDRPPIALAVFPAWILDNCATTQEAVDLLESTPFTLYGASFDGGTATTLHWGITDRSGHTVVLEFTNGVMHIYPTAPDIRCMTNDPMWPSMLAIIGYWTKIGGHNAMPGTVSSPDRCVRGNYFANHVRPTADATEGAAICQSVLAPSTVPYDYTLASDAEPNVSMTQWTSFSNLRDLYYYFHPVTQMGLWYVDLSTLDLYPGAPVLKLTVDELAADAGCVNKRLRTAEPFTPMY